MRHIAAFIAAAFIAAAQPASGAGIAFHVSTAGNDSWTGTSPAPNVAGADGPFATLERARDAVRALRTAGKYPKSGGATVLIHAGTYRIEHTLALTSEDSGTKQSPMTWRAAPGEAVRFIGGTAISGFAPVSDRSVLGRLDPAARGNVLCASLKARGVAEYGEIDPKSGKRMELYERGEAMTLARWPNDGWLGIADVPQTGEKLVNPGLDREIAAGAAIPRGRHYGRFAYDGDRPSRWAASDDIWMHGYWVWDWSDGYQRVARIDMAKREIYPSEPHHSYGYTKGQRYYFLNILEELDTPGEWYLDRASGMLYILPRGPVRDGDIVATLLETPMISIDGASFITVRGIAFEDSRAGAVRISGGSDNRLAGCSLRNLGNTAVTVSGGLRNGVTGCDIHDVAAGCINLDGGDRITLTPAGNYATNNYLHHFGKVFRTGNPGVGMSGVGNILAHNLIHDAPNAAVFFSGNDHLLEFNEVHDIALETGDVGAFYAGRDWTMRGHTIRFNYFHDLHNSGDVGVMGVYLDDSFSSATIFGNIFVRAGRAAFIGGGRDNTVENNIFVDCAPSVHIDGRGMTWCKGYNARGGAHQMYEKLEAVKWNRPPYSARYPALASLLDGDPDYPAGNRVIRNISYGGRWMDLYDGLAPADIEIRDNLAADPDLLRYIPKGANEFVTVRRGASEAASLMTGVTVMTGDPGFADVKNGDYRLVKDSPAWKLGFKPIPVDKIGLYKDEFRTTIQKK